jgi:hypothetical protein
VLADDVRPEVKSDKLCCHLKMVSRSMVSGQKKILWIRWESQGVVATTSVVLLQHVGTIGWWGSNPLRCLSGWSVGRLDGWMVG